MNDPLYTSYLNHFKNVVLPVATKAEKIRTNSIKYVIIQIITGLVALAVLRSTVSPEAVKTVTWIAVIVIGGAIALQIFGASKRTQKIALECHHALLSFYGDTIRYEKLDRGETTDWLYHLYKRHAFVFKKDGITITNTYKKDEDSYHNVGFEIRWKHNIKNVTPTYILTDRTEKYLGKVSVFFQGIGSSRPPVVHLQHKKFEHLFRVHSHNKDFVERTLTLEVQQLLADWKAARNIQIHISHNEVVVHYKTDRELFGYEISARSYADRTTVFSLFNCHQDALKIQGTLRQIFGDSIVWKMP